MNLKKSLWFKICIIINILMLLIGGYHLCNVRFFGSYTDLDIISTNHITQEEQKCIIVDHDPFLVYQLSDEEVYSKCKLDVILDSDATFQIFYKNAEQDFIEERSLFVNAKIDEKEIIFELPNEAINCLRIDIHEYASDTFQINGLTLAQDGMTLFTSAAFSLENIALLMVFNAILLCVYFIYSKQIISKIKERINVLGCEDLIVILLLAIVSVIVYWRYLSGSALYVFSDIGRDSFVQTYPGLLNLADRIQSGEWGAGFDFNQGLGNPHGAIGINLTNWVALFGREHVAYLLGVSQWLKVLGSSILAYYFARLNENPRKLSLIVALGYAYCAHMIVRGSWPGYPNETLLLIMWLTAYEYTKRKKTTVVLPIATVIFFVFMGTYYGVLWGLLLGLYILFREIVDTSDKIDIKNIVKIEGVFYIFVALVNANLFKGVESAVESARFTSGTDKFSEITSNFFVDFEELTTAFLRTIGMSINGISGDYVGFYNYLEGPAFYCGILLVTMVPVSLYNMQGIKKILYSLACIAGFLYVAIRPLRYIANGFAKDSYKMSSFWITIFIILIAIDVLKKIFNKEDLKKYSLTVFNGTVLFVCVWCYVAYKLGMITRINDFYISAVFIVIYTILVNCFVMQQDQAQYVPYMLCLCVIVEVVGVSWSSINDRTTLMPDETNEKIYYNDYTVEALDFINERDDGFYRIEKRYQSVFLCDSLAQNYYGTKSYVGGTQIGASVLNLYAAFGLPQNGNHYLLGTGGNIYANSLLSVKYVLSKEDMIPRYGYKCIGKTGDVYIYENELVLPLVYMYSTVMDEENFWEYSSAERSGIILERCVMPNVQEGKRYHYNKTDELNAIEFLQDDSGYVLQEKIEDEVVVFKFETKEDISGVIYFETTDGVQSSNNYSCKAGEISEIELYLDGLHKIWMDNMNLISNVEFYSQVADEYYASMKENVQKLSKNAMKIDFFDESRIEGTIVCEEDIIMASAIPYDENWKILIDGQPVDAMRVNVGCVGAYVSEGEHDVEIYYEVPVSYVDSILKGTGLMIALLWFISLNIKKRGKTNEKYISSSTSL